MSEMSVPRALEVPELRRHPLRAVRVPAAGGTYRFVAPRARSVAAPYWARVWPASIALFRRILRGSDLAGRHAADVGCGIGLCGAALGLRGARVTFCDREPDALRFAVFNAGELGVADARALRFDWEVDALPDDVDLVALSDVVYEYRHVRPLLRLCDRVLERGGRVLVADPERPTAHDFAAALAARGATVLRAAAEDPDGGARVDVRILELDGGAG